MDSLSSNWFIEGKVDFEQKKYVILNYLQKINHHFHAHKLYPDLNDLIFHYNNLAKIKENKTLIQNSFPQILSEADLKAVKLTYEKIIKDDSLMQEIEQIISFALESMDPALREGKEIFEFIERQMNIESIGVIPLYPYRGYMLLRNGSQMEIHVYEYQMEFFKSKNETHRGLTTNYLKTYKNHFMHSPEAIRKELIFTRVELVNPAVFHVESEISFPLDQTLLPLAKRSLIKKIANAA